MAAAIAVAALAVGALFNNARGEWEREVDRVSMVAEAFKAATLVHMARADSLVDLADAYAVEVETHKAALVDALAADTVPTPPGCEVVVGIKNRIISECQLALMAQGEEVDVLRRSGDELRLAEVNAMARGDSLQQVLDDRPMPKPGWIPSVSIGPFAGFCTNGQQCVGVGVQLSWEVNLF